MTRLLLHTAVATALAAGALGLTQPARASSDGVHTVRVPDGDPHERSLAPRTTEPFSMIGVTWDDPDAALDGTAQVRTRSRESGEWSAWRPLDTDVRTPETGPDRLRAGVRGGTQPLWTGPSDGVQVRVSGARLPEGLRVELVDPDGGPDAVRTTVVEPDVDEPDVDEPDVDEPDVDEPDVDEPDVDEPDVDEVDVDEVDVDEADVDEADVDEPDVDEPDVVEPAAVEPAAGGPSAQRPAVTSRSGWGADESLVKDPPTYTTNTQAMFVHHTAGTNDYSCAESASVVRGVFLYHVRSNGWNDIGYHFLVDKCGTVFEGRAGGIDKPVLGAHTYGFNAGTSSISVLGDYNKTTANTAVRESVAKVAAWKLGLYGIDPTGTVVLTAGADNGKYKAGQKATLPRISGHRDGYPTECPGQHLYDDLPEIRTLAGKAAKPEEPAPDPTAPGTEDDTTVTLAR
ncbi:peptidoglycan recognition protein family protein [Streptomyces sp. DH10]|uniref:peptidoglycan recognition protein family protein n=1 Tax=Streptomyces sp. DH10 TaxID=3040121 RepID=UPI002442ABBD|nr:peptidoglycan recognition protein [Streptomyces sp. DH10]MDG9708416.1 peptidoglycan recognition protein [Streptomyces sp. DH10]